MSDKKGWGSTVLGWFVVRPEDAPTADATGAEVGAPAVDPGGANAAAAGGDAGQAVAMAPMSDPPPAPGGKVDYSAVFTAAGVDPEQQERVDKAASLLGSLPADTPPAVKKQIVEASLRAFGVPIDKIIEAGVEEIQALEAYIQAGAADTQKLLAESQDRIAKFQQEMQRIQRVAEERGQEQQMVVASCNERKLAVQRVLEFFGQEAVARVVRDSPKLIDPKQAQASRS